MELRSRGRLGREPGASFEALHREGLSGWLDIGSLWVRRSGSPRVNVSCDVMCTPESSSTWNSTSPRATDPLPENISYPILVVALDLEYASTLEADPDFQVCNEEVGTVLVP